MMVKIEFFFLLIFFYFQVESIEQDQSIEKNIHT